MPRYAHWAARLQPLLNAARRSCPGAGALLEAIGFDRRRAAAEVRDASSDEPRAPARCRGDGRRGIVLFADTFNNWFEPENLARRARVLEATGHQVIAPQGADGRGRCAAAARTSPRE